MTTSHGLLVVGPIAMPFRRHSKLTAHETTEIPSGWSFYIHVNKIFDWEAHFP